jgi:hypothetical protein
MFFWRCHLPAQTPPRVNSSGKRKKEREQKKMEKVMKVEDGQTEAVTRNASLL